MNSFILKNISNNNRNGRNKPIATDTDDSTTETKIVLT